jgi:hypothetical protein
LHVQRGQLRQRRQLRRKRLEVRVVVELNVPKAVHGRRGRKARDVVLHEIQVSADNARASGCNPQHVARRDAAAARTADCEGCRDSRAASHSMRCTTGRG